MKQTSIAKAITLLPQQKAVIDWVTLGQGSLQLVARAGCGKTFTLMEIVKVIVANKLGDVALMAFNKSIATELSEKLERLGIKWPTAEAGTVHSFGYRAWRKVAPSVQINEDKVRNIIETMYEQSYNPILLYCRGAIAKFVGLAKQTGFGIPRQGYAPVDDKSAWLEIWEHHVLEDDVANVIDEDGNRIPVNFYDIVDIAIAQVGWQ
jgi:hypothetical protein